MEHILQFGISIDDDAIKKRILETAETKIISELKEDISKHLFYYDYKGDKNGLHRNVDKLLQKWFDDHKDEIIKLAVDRFIDRMMRTKIVKNAITDVVQDIKNKS